MRRLHDKRQQASSTNARRVRTFGLGVKQVERERHKLGDEGNEAGSEAVPAAAANEVVRREP